MVVSPLVNERLSTQLAETMTDVDEARPDPTRIVVRLDRDGAIKINNDTITPDTYVNVLHERLLSRGPGNKLVLFDADDAAGYGKLVNALDGAKQAGAVTLGFVMPEPKADK